jgi:hypothetical protein
MCTCREILEHLRVCHKCRKRHLAKHTELEALSSNRRQSADCEVNTVTCRQVRAHIRRCTECKKVLVWELGDGMYWIQRGPSYTRRKQYSAVNMFRSQ